MLEIMQLEKQHERSLEATKAKYEQILDISR